jgi:integrase
VKVARETKSGIRKRVAADGRVRYQAFVWRQDDDSGKWRQQTVGTFSTEKAAEKAQRAAAVKRDRGQLAKKQKDTIAELLDVWITTKRGKLKANSVADYESAIRLHLLPAFGDVQIQKLRHQDIQRVVNGWRDGEAIRGAAKAPVGTRGRKQERSPKPLGARLIHRCHSVLSQALDMALRSGAITVNPADHIELPSIPNTKRTLKPWSPEQVSSFLDYAAGDDLAPIWHLLALEGLRKGEALGLRWSDLAYRADGTITAQIAQQVIVNKAGRGEAIIQPTTKTAAGARVIQFTSETARALKDHKTRQQFALKAAGEKWDDDAHIVSGLDGMAVHPTAVQPAMERIIKAAGLPRVTPHDLRHGAASMLLAAGIPVPEVSARMGHASPAVTMEIYAHVLNGAGAQSANAIDALLELARVKKLAALDPAL